MPETSIYKYQLNDKQGNCFLYLVTNNNHSGTAMLFDFIIANPIYAGPVSYCGAITLEKFLELFPSLEAGIAKLNKGYGYYLAQS